MKNKKAQQEMLGFALIIIIVSVLLIIFIGFSYNKSQDSAQESYEVELFLQSVIEFTTNCSQYSEYDYLPIRRVLFKCINNEECFDGSSSCQVLNSTLKSIFDSAYKVGENYPQKGYNLNITVIADSGFSKEFLSFSKGNRTKLAKGSSQPFDGGTALQFTVYS